MLVLIIGMCLFAVIIERKLHVQQQNQFGSYCYQESGMKPSIFETLMYLVGSAEPLGLDEAP